MIRLLMEAYSFHRMDYQRKSYTSGEIDVAWLKDWDAQTKVMANRRT
jgi:hypothetical protein